MFGVPSSFAAWVFLKSVGLGVLLGAGYFLFMALRTVTPDKKVFVALQDALFFIGAAFVTFLFAFDVDAGVSRAYIFAGEAAGACLFYALPARALRRRLRGAVGRVKRVLAERKRVRRRKRENRQKKSKKS